MFLHCLCTKRNAPKLLCVGMRSVYLAAVFLVSWHERPSLGSVAPQADTLLAASRAGPRSHLRGQCRVGRHPSRPYKYRKYVICERARAAGGARGLVPSRGCWLPGIAMHALSSGAGRVINAYTRDKCLFHGRGHMTEVDY